MNVVGRIDLGIELDDETTGGAGLDQLVTLHPADGFIGVVAKPVRGKAEFALFRKRLDGRVVAGLHEAHFIDRLALGPAEEIIGIAGNDHIGGTIVADELVGAGTGRMFADIGLAPFVLGLGIGFDQRLVHRHHQRRCRHEGRELALDLHDQRGIVRRGNVFGLQHADDEVRRTLVDAEQALD